MGPGLNVRFGSKADIGDVRSHVRFTPQKRTLEPARISFDRSPGSLAIFAAIRRAG